MTHTRDANFFEEFYNIYQKIPVDFLGGSPLEKTYLMAYLANIFDLKNYVEIGIYRGKSFFPVTAAFAKNNGLAIGIDPYCLKEALQNDMETDVITHSVNETLNKLNFEEIYRDVLVFKEQLDFSDKIKIIRTTSTKATDQIKNNNILIDMLHINKNHDTQKVKEDIHHYLPLVKEGGFVVVDDINCPSVKLAYDEIKNDFLVVFENDFFSILWKQSKTTGHLTRCKNISKKIEHLHKKLIGFGPFDKNNFSPEITVTVGVLTYNHEKYIQECLDSIYSQNGGFKIKVIICDDHSTDNTVALIDDYIKVHKQKENLEFVFIRNPENIGVCKNLANLVHLSKGCDYLTFCEGDDYWIDSNRIINHIQFLQKNPECALSYNLFLIYYEDKKAFDLFKPAIDISGELFETQTLVRENFIGNFSACFYDGKYLDNIPSSLFDIVTVDWFFNIFYSTFGDIGYINKPMSIYRKHSQSVWSSLSHLDSNTRIQKYIVDYNTYLNFDFNKEFAEYQNRCLNIFDGQYVLNLDMIIIDDAFPHPLSSFRYQEFCSYFEHIKSMKILTTGNSTSCLGKESIDDLIVDYKRKYPVAAGKLDKWEQWRPVGCKLLYFIFLNNVYSCLSIAETMAIPFVFTLYPNGGFAIDNPDSDAKLRTVCNSPYFKRVIVTQKITYDYLIQNNFCPPDKIEFIYGAVAPLEKLQIDYPKIHFKFGKNTLDICFVAHKYTQYGQDKGYDTFVAVAKILCSKYNNIYFHVVGSFDSTIIDISSIKDRINFYGTQNQEWFDDFFIDKDIILSPNKSGLIFKGSFDGFPTASCTDAGLRKTAMFCADELNLNDGYFKDGNEIIIIPLEVNGIIEKIEHHYKNPLELKKICEAGSERIRHLSSFDRQLAPRIAILKQEIATSFIYRNPLAQNTVPINNNTKAFIKRTIKKFCPTFLKKPGRKLVTFIRTF